jgi:hypothetical protein
LNISVAVQRRLSRFGYQEKREVIMSCYFRHMADVLAEAGIDLDEVKADKARKKELDAKIHELVGVEYKDCPSTWKKVKEMLADDKEHARLVKALKS